MPIDCRNRANKIEYLNENVAAAFVQLTPAETKRIRDAIERIGVHGDRYPSKYTKSRPFAPINSCSQCNRMEGTVFGDALPLGE